MGRWTEGYALGGHAVLAAEVAAFGEGDAEVVVVAVVRVCEYVAGAANVLLRRDVAVDWIG